MSGLDIGFDDRDGFRRGVHWLFEDAPEDVLWVTFSTAGRKPGSFNNFRSLMKYPGKKLYISDPESLYYQKMIGNISALLAHIRQRFAVSYAIYWGSSMGAYAAVLFGILGVIAGRCYAFAPQLDLRHRTARAIGWIKDASLLHPTYTDLRPMLRERGFRDLNALFPCYEQTDGIHVEDARQLGRQERELAFVGTSHRVLEDFIAGAGRDALEQCFVSALEGRNIAVPPGFIPTERDIELSIRAYACMAFAAGHGPAPDLAVDDGDTANHAWLNAKQRALTTLGRHEEAIAAGLRSIGLAPAKVEYLFCTANSYAASRLPYGPMLAEGLYREALRLRPRHEPVRRSLAATLRRRGLVEEARAIEQGPG